jgi:hypothetical protein
MQLAKPDPILEQPDPGTTGTICKGSKMNLLQVRGKQLGILLVMSTILLSTANSGAPLESAVSCDDFRRLLDTPAPKGIGRYQLEKSLPIGGSAGNERYFNLDIDGDDVNDLVTASCPGSATSPDPCGLLIQLSSGKKIEFYEDRFYLVRYRSRIFAVANHRGPNVDIGKRKIYRVSPVGVQLVCEKL